MPTYDKFPYNIPAYQEGNQQDFEFDLDENFPIDQVSDITFQVKSDRAQTLISLKKSTGGILQDNRYIRIPFEPADTKGRVGVHMYEIDFINLQGKPFATIGGTFTINKEVDTL
jgi:hypothetical protein